MLPDPSQETWPFGPAPRRECANGGEHKWSIINLFAASDPPAPTFWCPRCGWKWSRPWTQPEFDRWLEPQGPASKEHYGVCKYPSEPDYAD